MCYEVSISGLCLSFTVPFSTTNGYSFEVFTEPKPISPFCIETQKWYAVCVMFYINFDISNLTIVKIY